jgi:hypothetical protein
MVAALAAAENLVQNPGFEDPADLSWNLNNWAKNAASGIFDTEKPRAGARSYRLAMTKITGKPELHFQQKLEIGTIRKVRVTFAMRGTGEKKVDVLIRKIGSPWTKYASRQVKPTPAWKGYAFTLALPELDPADTGIFFVLNEAATLWLDEVSVTPAPKDEGFPTDLVASLDGTWSVSAPGAWAQEVPVPGFLENLSGTKGLHQFTYTRTFEVPEAGDERRVFLRFDAVGDAADVRVNGQHAGGHLGAALPFEVDITELVEVPSTTNRLEVLVRDDTHFSVPRESTDWRNRKHWIPRGMGMNNRKGLYQSVSLVCRPSVQVADTFIRTSVREKKLTATCEVFNGRKEALRAQLTASVLDAGGDEVLTLPPVEAELGGFVRTRMELAAPCGALTTWQPDHPALYTLRVRLQTKEGAGLHETRTRFGYREAWLEGIHFMLNGIRCNLRGESPSYGEKRELFFTRESASAMLKKYQQVNFNVLRFHSLPPPPHVLDLCDELGILVIGESAIYASWKMLMPEHPDFMRHCREHLERWVRRDRNHPSVVLWSAENEGLNVSHLSQAQLAEFRRVIDGQDGTRAVLFDGDGTGFGASPVSVKHYIRTIEDLQDQGGKSSGYAKDLRSDIYWATNFRQAQPLGAGEFLFPYEPGIKDKEREAIYMMGLQTRGYRLADWFDIRPYNPSYCGFLRPEGVKPGLEEAYDIIVKSFAPVAAFDLGYDELGPFPKAPELRVGQPARRTLVVYNDAFSDTAVELNWSASLGGKRLAGEKVALTIPLGAHLLRALSFTPTAPGDLSLELSTAKGGKKLFSDSRRFVVVP